MEDEHIYKSHIWTSGYYANTVGQYASKDAIVKYIQNQGKERTYSKIYQAQLKFDL